MKANDVRLTMHETEQLCRLYMDCQLTVLEETELQYVLGKLPYSSPCIDEVRALMGISVPESVKRSSKKRFGRFYVRTVLDIAASIAILFAVGAFLFLDRDIPGNDNVNYIAAYSQGRKLNGTEAVSATNRAISRADSLMRYASLTEHNYMMKANDIISATSNN